MATMGQTVSGDFDSGEVVCEGGSLGPVGSPGWRSRDWSAVEVVRGRPSGRRAVSGLRRKVGRTARDMARVVL